LAILNNMAQHPRCFFGLIWSNLVQFGQSGGVRLSPLPDAEIRYTGIKRYQPVLAVAEDRLLLQLCSTFAVPCSGLAVLSFGIRPSDFGFPGRSARPGTPYPRTDRQVVRISINIGPISLSNRQPLDNNVKDRCPDEKICEILSNFTVSINNKPSGNRQEVSTNRQIPGNSP
jgi:hypothetical protein